MSISKTWGTDPSERKLPYPCDAVVPGAQDEYFRGITVNASSAVVFRWLCQLRAGPYSYDMIDNLGRKSSTRLTPGLENLARGQIFMYGFELMEFEKDRHITLKSRGGSLLIGIIGVSYCLQSRSDHSSRLLVKVSVRYPAGPVGWGMRALLPWGDLFMMRKQMMNFKALAEAQARTSAA
ncbi:MAG TPA: hypothetical protein VJ385_03615 [Fibrobacteria bacterium]|nr:hypothetical protein [Fibrobacteria bacterium]